MSTLKIPMTIIGSFSVSNRGGRWFSPSYIPLSGNRVSQPPKPWVVMQDWLPTMKRKIGKGGARLVQVMAMYNPDILHGDPKLFKGFFFRIPNYHFCWYLFQISRVQNGARNHENWWKRLDLMVESWHQVFCRRRILLFKDMENALFLR